MPKVRVNDIDIHYEVTNFCDPWRKPETVLLHHGFARNLNFWYRWVHALCRDFRVVTFDSRGCGETALPASGIASLTLDQLADDAIGLIDALGIDRVHWASEASGGIVGIVTALKYPERLHSLAMNNTPIRLPQSANDVFIDAEVRAHGTGYWARKTSSRRVDDDKLPREWIEWSIAEHDRTPPETAIAIHRMLEQADSFPLLPKLTMPVLILASGKSQIATRDEMETMASLIPRNKIVVFEDYGQGIAWMIPERCAEELKIFIRDIER